MKDGLVLSNTANSLKLEHIPSGGDLKNYQSCVFQFEKRQNNNTVPNQIRLSETSEISNPDKSKDNGNQDPEDIQIMVYAKSSTNIKHNIIINENYSTERPGKSHRKLTQAEIYSPPKADINLFRATSMKPQQKDDILS